MQQRPSSHRPSRYLASVSYRVPFDQVLPLHFWGKILTSESVWSSLLLEVFMIS